MTATLNPKFLATAPKIDSRNDALYRAGEIMVFYFRGYTNWKLADDDNTIVEEHNGDEITSISDWDDSPI